MLEGRRESGFSLVELVVAIGLSLAVMAGVFSVLQPSRRRFEAEAEMADVQQRLRVAADTLFQDLSMAGAGAYIGPGAGPLLQFFAPVLPYGPGADPATAFRTDLVWLVYVPDGAPQTTTANAVPTGSGDVMLSGGPGCAVGDPACGFAPGTTALVFDAAGAWDVFDVEAANGATLSIRRLTPDATRAYAAGSRIVQVVSRTYFLERDAGTDGDQLVRQDTGGSAVPVVDHVVKLAFAYYGDPKPPELLGSTAGPGEPWDRRTTYGPAPPEPDSTATAYPPGENCTFQTDPATGEQSPRLTGLGAAAAYDLVPLNAPELTDGPWCPDAASTNRFDADLLRVRSIAVTIRVESALASLRGPAGVLFARAGTAEVGTSFVPDRVAHLAVTPRNLAVPR